jgi:PilZ domain
MSPSPNPTNPGQRPSIRFSVTLLGTDRFGKPFLQDARALEVNRLGALIDGFTHRVNPGSTLEIHYQREKASFLVVWVGKEGTDVAGQAWVRPVEADRNIWGVPLENPSQAIIQVPREAETVSGSPNNIQVAGSWSGTERRKHFRYRCQGKAFVSVKEDSDQGHFGIFTDITVGGCYVEMGSPFPLGIHVYLKLSVDGAEASVEGRVRSSCPGLGMGISFRGTTPQQLEQLSQLIDRAAGGPEAADRSDQTRARIADDPPETIPPPTPEGDVRMLLEALVEVLQRKGHVNAEELREALEEIRFAGRDPSR